MHGYGEAEKGVIEPEFNRSVLIDFKGAKITSDAGVLMLKEVDERFDVIGKDHDPGTGQSMLSRLENGIFGNTSGLASLDEALFRSNDVILSNQDKRRLIIDLDSTEDPAYGYQENIAYNGRVEIENRIKEGKNTLRWDKTSCHRFEANHARLKMGVLADNLLHMIRILYLYGEEVRRLMEWLIHRLIKVGAKIGYHDRRWNVHITSVFPLAHHYRAVLGYGYPGRGLPG